MTLSMRTLGSKVVRDRRGRSLSDGSSSRAVAVGCVAVLVGCVRHEALDCREG
jgi:hypothetical protein